MIPQLGQPAPRPHPDPPEDCAPPGGPTSLGETRAYAWRRAAHLREVSVDLSPVVNPLAYNEIATASTSDSRRCRFLTNTGSNVPARSRETSISTSPADSVNTVLERLPLRMFPASRWAGGWCACRSPGARSSPPPGPTSAPWRSSCSAAARADQILTAGAGPLTSSRTAAGSASPSETLFLAAFSNGLTPTSVSVIGDQPSSPTQSRIQARTTVQRTCLLVGLRGS